MIYANPCIVTYFRYNIYPEHTTSTKSEKHLNRPLTKPQKPKTSKSTTRQTLTSKSLCHVENHAFGLVPTKRYFDDFNTSIFCPKTSETPYLLGFSHTRQFTLVINTTRSTCSVHGNISTGTALSGMNPMEANNFRSRAKVSGAHET